MEFVFIIVTAASLTTTTTTTAATTPPITTVPRTTTPPGTPPGGCLHYGKHYLDGENIEKDPYNCYGTYCDGGAIVSWDGECFFRTPYCNGWSERVLGQCCPICHNMTTIPTTIPPSSTPQDGCVYEEKIYANGEYVEKDPYDCFGSKCEYGVVNTWQTNCWYPPNVCKGGWRNITGECCKVCVNITSPQPETTTSTSGPQQKCKIGDRHYIVGQRTNTDPCHVCTCTIDGTESCLNITCDDTVLDCDVKYKPDGMCCFTCGSSQFTTSLFLLLTLFLISKEIQLL
ncbi:kielin/chordin-like protein [Mercenaria mercenaria]|uniref:kielin/chordin-like protein n=1 Tax=Mercenaria mercenaria TaxID=6596 RepID=UPI00234F89C7|nr:kielin/chordin-like protein [Mercenaria mercenaria]